MASLSISAIHFPDGIGFAGDFPRAAQAGFGACAAGQARARLQDVAAFIHPYAARRARTGTGEAMRALFRVVQKLGRKILAFGIMTPKAG